MKIMETWENNKFFLKGLCKRINSLFIYDVDIIFEFKPTNNSATFQHQ